MLEVCYDLGFQASSSAHARARQMMTGLDSAVLIPYLGTIDAETWY
jgi:hypothetical protein